MNGANRPTADGHGGHIGFLGVFRVHTHIKKIKMGPRPLINGFIFDDYIIEMAFYLIAEWSVGGGIWWW